MPTDPRTFFDDVRKSAEDVLGEWLREFASLTESERRSLAAEAVPVLESAPPPAPTPQRRRNYVSRQGQFFWRGKWRNA